MKYICNENSHLLPYIKHRVNKIRHHSNIENWSYIKMTDNTADYCTRPRNMGNYSNQKQFLIEAEISYQKELTKSSCKESPTQYQ